MGCTIMDLLPPDASSHTVGTKRQMSSMRREARASIPALEHMCSWVIKGGLWTPVRVRIGPQVHLHGNFPRVLKSSSALLPVDVQLGFTQTFVTVHRTASWWWVLNQAKPSRGRADTRARLHEGSLK